MTGRRGELPALVWKPAAAVRRFLTEPATAEGYLTVSTVDAERHEAQLGRLDTGVEPVQGWLVRLVQAHLEVAAEGRFRLRRWGGGGRPAGSVSFVVSRPATATDVRRGPAAGDDLAPRLAAVEAGAAASQKRIARLETRLAAAEQLIEAMKPIVTAAEQALLIIGGSDSDE